MSPGKARLWTGMSCVGTLVVVTAAMLFFDAPGTMLATAAGGGVSEYMTILAFFGAAAALLLPFDFIGGMLIPAAFEKQPPRMGQWFRCWFRSVTLQLLFFSTTFFFYLQIGREIGAPWLIALFAVLQVTLLAGQELIWQLMTAQRIGAADGGTAAVGGSAHYVRHSDQRFVGGITGLPGFESILIPDDWRSRLDPSHLKVVINRRLAALRSGGRFRGILLAMVWNITSFTAAIVASGSELRSVADLVTIFLWFLLFSFVGLLILPTFNRRSVFGLDRQVSGIVNVHELQQAISEIDQLTEQDPTRTVSAESVFQPIPCPARRLQALAEQSSPNVPAWNVARTALFLSWAFGGPLARAVHCNVGRPELWAMLPTD
ncbi:MAG: hypothetical protein RIK87_22410 [Fuerstiella sp.]